jgi:hypothetical protein
MEVVAPSKETVAVLREIARTGFRYEQTKELAEIAGWKLDDDELDLGYVAFNLLLRSNSNARRRLAVQLSESGRPPRAFIPLYYFEDYDQTRSPFDEAYRTLSEQLDGVLGPQSSSGLYEYPFRERWTYLYSWWSLADAAFALVQDELDIQFGMDITLWLLPTGVEVRVPVRCE